MAQYSIPATDGMILSKMAADRLIAGRDGALALAYLCLLRAGAGYGPEALAAELGVSQQEAERLLQKLAENGLAAAAGEKKEYTAEDVAAAVGQKEFGYLVEQAEYLFGEKLAVQDIQRLLYIYDGLGMPAEVILQMMQYFKSDVRRKYGPGRRLSASRLERMAAEWKKQGIVTLPLAEAYIRKREAWASREGEIKRVLEIYDRKLTDGERKYIESWIGMGFDTDAVRMCYERTLDRIHTLNFKYMDGIFLSWHGKGLHTAEEIEKGDSPRTARTLASSRTASAGAELPGAEETERLKRLTESMKGEGT